MTIDAALLGYYRAAAEAFPPLPANADARTVRQRFQDVARAFSLPRGADVLVSELALPLAGRELAARVYRPAAATGALPLLVYFHGGGWVVGDLDTHDTLVERLAVDANCAVVSVDYRLAPEHPFPAPCDDALDSLLWLAEHRSRLGFATDRLAVGGDSAGAHLATVAARGANERVAGIVSLQLLLYPVMRRQFESASCVANANGPGLTNDEMKWYWEQFLGGREPDRHDVRVFPLAEPYERAPAPALIVAAAHDPLYDDAFELARFLSANGGRAEMIDAGDMTHGFGRIQAHAPAAAAWMKTIGERTGEMLRAAR
ncbi:Esterase/lipase [Caballeronia glathei]|jgi:acetyl esterase|uniref:Alpha/beta hydrolase n=1 Tax=Caballeronia glathei TaxID=60547 RepID=A0A069PJD8_9BURK|nr:MULTISPECIES: alpha/beta hydrolase [Burkholderiaceae]KDR40044.1 alpha/beta hydrolase [Caballeronia glathei]TCK42069.1 acetyl esterase [Paraburkholderia sp. BL8N3]CDY78324.1 Esterase/lipase [Caballeronia glathei]